MTVLNSRLYRRVVWSLVAVVAVGALTYSAYQHVAREIATETLLRHCAFEHKTLLIIDGKTYCAKEI